MCLICVYQNDKCEIISRHILFFWINIRLYPQNFYVVSTRDINNNEELLTSYTLSYWVKKNLNLVNILLEIYQNTIKNT